MTRYITYTEIAAAVQGMPIILTEEELIRVSRQTYSTLKHIRLAGRRSPALWRLDDFESWLARRLKNAPEILEQIMLRLNAPVTATNKKTKVRTS